jgi:hypothetical protein
MKKYVIRYNSETKVFYMLDKDNKLVAEHSNGRELGRDAWYLGAEEVRFDYDLNLDEKIPLIPFYEKSRY